METTQSESPHPLPALVRALAGRFHRAAERDGIIDMMHENTKTVARDNVCRTILCIAGHYALQAAIDRLDANSGATPCDDAGTIVVDWGAGAMMMANDLGMANDEHLMGWADAQRELWGNSEGWEMFYQTNAYEGATTPLTLHGVAAHWEGVADRIEALRARKPH